jgi:ketosteroid isomerase-like protein
MKTALFFITIFFSALHLRAQMPDDVLIKNTLAEQTTAWNNGDLDKFMDGYWRSDSLMFVGKSGPTYGWENTLKNYRKGYPDIAAMGKLNFNLISVKRLSPLYYSVVGKWHLKRSMGDVGGAFTLLFKKIKKKWVIVQDHSS